jgi:hypothetical protein
MRRRQPRGRNQSSFITRLAAIALDLPLTPSRKAG